MMQKSIRECFQGVQKENSDTEVEEYEDRDVAYFQQLVKKQETVKEYAKIITSSGSGAECWKYFGQLYVGNKLVLPNKKFCKCCLDENTILKGFGPATSTTNYTKHLINYHNRDIKCLNYKKTNEATKNSLTSTSKATKFANARRIAEMCCIDLQPFHIVERIGFRKYVKQGNPTVEFPTSITVGNGALNNVYEVYLSAVKKELAKCPNEITLVLDMWTDKYKKISYINTKVHYCENFSIKCFSLHTEHFPHPHTANAIADKVLASLKQFNLEERAINAVTDGGSNIVAALKLRNIQRFDCLAHKLHRFLSHDILNNPTFSNINNIVTKLKKIFRALTYRGEEITTLQNIKQHEKVFELIQEIENLNSAIETDDIYAAGDIDAQMESSENFTCWDLESQLEIALNTPHPETLKNSVDTRWNSILRMIKSFSDNFEVINYTLLKIGRCSILIGEMERKLIKEFQEFLAIFSEATTYLQGQEYATVSTCIYFFESIYSKLVQEEGFSSFEIIIHLYSFAKQNFFKRFKILKIHLVAALMDPVQKNWSILENYVQKVPDVANLADTFLLDKDVPNPTTKEKLILNEIKKFNINKRLSSSNTEQPPPKKDKVSETRKRMITFVSQSQQCDVADDLVLEVQKYLQVKVSQAETLEWWQEHKLTFPTVAKLANIFLGIPATSASSEIAFSVAGSCITEKRSRLHPTTAKKQLFVHDNYKMVQELL